MTEAREDLSGSTYKARLHRRRMAVLEAWWEANGYTVPLEFVNRGDAWEEEESAHG